MEIFGFHCVRTKVSSRITFGGITDVASPAPLCSTSAFMSSPVAAATAGAFDSVVRLLTIRISVCN